MLAGLEPANVPLGEDDLQKGAAIAKNFPPRLVKQMDLSVDPCEDFYSYACGGFMEHTQIPEDLGASRGAGTVAARKSTRRWPKS